MIYNVIPVNYFGGLGGQFLSSFLFSARTKDYDNWNFSENGQCHGSSQDRSLELINRPGIIDDPTGDINLNLLIEYAKTVPNDIIYYPQSHLANPDKVLEYFNKQIKIYCDPEQFDEIIGVIMSKLPVHFAHVIKHKTSRAWIQRKQLMQLHHRLTSNCPDLETRMLNISWNEMVYLDPDILVSKLSKFTLILKEDFDTKRFSEWRTLTLNTIKKLNLRD